MGSCDRKELSEGTTLVKMSSFATDSKEESNKQTHFDTGRWPTSKAQGKVVVPDAIGGFAAIVHQTKEMSLQETSTNSDQNLRHEAGHKNDDVPERLPTINRSIFELFDTNEGGSMNEFELQKTLAEFGINIKTLELVQETVRAKTPESPTSKNRQPSKVVRPDELGGFPQFTQQSTPLPSIPLPSEMSLQETSRLESEKSESEHKCAVGFEPLPPITNDGGNSGREPTLLTKGQVEAFKEVFELFEKNGGGTIDASELQKTLADIGITIEGADLHELMLNLDGEGNGEVDFDEFLKLMTETEMFIEALADKENHIASNGVSNRVILLDALTQFMKKQALSNASEIVGYYAKKYEKDAKKSTVRTWSNTMPMALD